jgi:hypothetical protein
MEIIKEKEKSIEELNNKILIDNEKEEKEIVSLINYCIDKNFINENCFLIQFIKEELKYIIRKETNMLNGMRWSNEMILFSLNLLYTGKKNYEKINNFFYLPSIRNLQYYKFSTENLFYGAEQLNKLIEKKNYIRKGGLIWDEISIKSGLVIGKGDELIGYSDNNDNLATHVLQFIFIGAENYFFVPVAHFLVSNLKSIDIKKYFWKVIKYLKINASVDIIFCCCDGGFKKKNKKIKIKKK